MPIEINGLGELEIFLRTRPVEWSRLLAARSALRVLPIIVAPGMPDRNWLPMFRACFISLVTVLFTEEDMNAAAISAAISAADSAAVSAARSTSRSVAVSAALSAADSAARSASRSATDFATRSAARAAVRSAVLSATRTGARRPYDARSDMWRALNADLSWLLDRVGSVPAAALSSEPLWHDNTPQWAAGRWRDFTANAKAAKEGYTHWFDWYEDLLAFRGPLVSDHLGGQIAVRIMQQSDAWWQRPSREVNNDISAWMMGRDAEKVVIPDPEPGTSLGLAEDGRIGIVPSGIPTTEEQHANEGLLEVLGEKVEELTALLAGSNAFALLLKDASKYAECLCRQPFSIDRLYARGNVLETTRAHLQKGIDAGELPDMALEVASGLDAVLAIHGPLIASTHQGQVLLERSHRYEEKSVDIAAQRLAARDLANAVARSDKLFTDEVRDEWPAMADGIGSGPYPARSTQVAMSGNHNLFVTLGKLVATSVVSEAVINSIPGALTITSLTATIDAAWIFMTSYLPVISQLVLASGPLLAWMKPVLRLVARGRLPR